MPSSFVATFCGALGTALFLLGLSAGLFHLTSSVYLVITVSFSGLLLLICAMVYWLELFPRWIQIRTKRRKNRLPKQLTLIGVLDVSEVEKNLERAKEMNKDTAEALMKSIRGIPYLIQAIQYSMETNLMSEMGQSILGTSVIHTAPGNEDYLMVIIILLFT